MYCLNCQSSALPLVDMRSQFLKLQDHQIDVLNVFAQCKQVKIEQPENAKLCSACVLAVCQEFCSKFVHYNPSTNANFSAPAVAKSQETVIVKNEVQQQQQQQHQQQQHQQSPFIVNNGMQQYLISFPQTNAQSSTASAHQQPMTHQMPFNAYQPPSVQHHKPPASVNVSSSSAATSTATSATMTDASKLCAIIQDGKHINILTDTGEVTQTNIPKCTMCNRTLKTFASLITHMSSGKCTKKPQKSKNKSHSNNQHHHA